MNVLGLPLDIAVSRLEAAGYAVETVETRSLKGVESPDSRRVVRAIEIQGEKPLVRLVYAEFKTETDGGSNAPKN